MAGFECEFVEKPPKVLQSECPICLLVLREPYQATCCGKSFCKECIERSKVESKRCPTCKTENFFSYPNKGLQQSLNDFEVYCSHKSKSCDWRGELRELDKHLNSDPPADKSLEGCPFTVISCPLNCAVKLSRNSLPSHLSSRSLHGCQILLLSSIFDKIRLVQKMPPQQKDQFSVEKVENLEIHDGYSVSALVPPLYVVLSNFEQHKRNDDRWYSPSFYTHLGGYKMCLEVLANGWAEGKGSHISLFVHLMCGEFDDQLEWPFRGEVTVQLQSVEKDGRHYKRTVPFDSTTMDSTAGRVMGGALAKTGRGFCKFASHFDIQAKYLNYDCLVICIHSVSIHK